jgi:hypothetical protein
MLEHQFCIRTGAPPFDMAIAGADREVLRAHRGRIAAVDDTLEVGPYAGT